MAERSGEYLMVEWSGGGGYGHYAWLLADGLAGEWDGPVTLLTRRGAELTELAHANAVEWTWDGAPDMPLGRRRAARVLAAYLGGWSRVVLRAARRPRPYVVHIQGGDMPREAPFLAALRLLGVRILVTAHNAVPHDASPWRSRWMRILYRFPHAIVTHTEESAETIRAITGGRRPIHVLRHPTYAPIAEHFGDPAVRPGPRPRVAHLGAVRPYKGLDRAVEAMRLVREAIPDAELRVAGKPGDTDGTLALLASLGEDGASANLGWLGIAELVDEARAAHVVLLGHRSKSESGVALLALGAGTPVVGPRTGAIARLLAPAPEWCYDPEDPADAGRVVTDLLRRIAAEPEAVEQRRREVVDAIPTWRASAREHLDFLASLQA